MDHAMMDHSEHTMPDMPGMDDMCSMDMLFTWNWNNLCVIFKWWHVRSFSSFIFTLISIAGLGIGYEYIRSKVRNKTNTKTGSGIRLPVGPEEEEESILTFNKTGSIARLQKSVLYAILVGYSYMIMLIFMTYNGWVMLSVVVGAGIGNYLFGTELNNTMACH